MPGKNSISTGSQGFSQLLIDKNYTDLNTCLFPICRHFLTIQNNGGGKIPHRLQTPDNL